ncbi:YqgE/AlgH family protein [Alphaproteobacteria bacterium]|nr:YqgE/AlgH family protein [Alphaproteobacteria bacterium]
MSDDNLDFSLAGRVLLAMPMLGDPRFNKAVILVCAHDENGAMGLVVNHRLPGVDFQELLDQLKIPTDIEVDLKNVVLPIFAGGPVEGSRGFLLHSTEYRQKDTIDIDDRFAVTGTIEALQHIVHGDGPDDILFILGYAGWTAGQLEQEIKDNAWLVSDPDPEVIFHQNHDEKWDMAARKMGIDPAMLSVEAGRA